MTKTTLLTAASVAAVLIAGGAHAGTISGAIGTTTPVPVTSATPFRIASERTDAADATEASGFKVVNKVSTPITVTNNTTQNYRVTFNVSGGTIASPSASIALAGVAQTAGVTFQAAGSTSTSATYIVTVSPTAGNITFDEVILTSTLSNSAAEASVGASATVELLAGGVATTVDTTANTTLVTYASILGGFSVTANNAIATLPDFKFLKAGATSPAIISGTADPTVSGSGSTAQLATAFTLAGTSGSFYPGLGGVSPSTITAANVVNGGTLVVEGGSQLNVLTPALTGVAATPTRTAGSASWVLTGGESNNLFTGSHPNFTLSQAGTPVAIQATTFTAKFTPTAATGYTLGGTSSTVPAGAISLDGVNFIAPWTTGSQAPSSTTIRLSNGATISTGPITLRLTNAVARAPGVTTGPGAAIADQTCTTFGSGSITVDANGELQIGGGELTTCFGAFLRGDLQINIQSSASQLTAKSRVTRTSDGTTFENSLGRFGAPVSY